MSRWVGVTGHDSGTFSFHHLHGNISVCVGGWGGRLFLPSQQRLQAYGENFLACARTRFSYSTLFWLRRKNKKEERGKRNQSWTETRLCPNICRTHSGSRRRRNILHLLRHLPLLNTFKLGKLQCTLPVNCVRLRLCRILNVWLV